MNNANDKRLFWACFIALVATAFGFIIRAMIMNDWKAQFSLTETEKGELFGVGVWPFAISIVLFSLVIDKIGYGRAVVFGLLCHIVSVVVTISAPWMQSRLGGRAGYWTLYLGNFVVALGNGTVEAYINPVVATMFSREKTKWLNILHAGWPGGLVVGGVITLTMSAFQIEQWQYKVGLLLIPTLLYGVMMIGCTFPVSERVAAGVSYRDMLKEAGILSALVVVALIVREVGRVFALSDMTQLIVGGAIILAYGAYVQSLGRILFFCLVLIMIPLAVTELGTDSWITSLMEPEMKRLGLQAGWVLVYTSLIMMVLRFFAGPIVHKLSPLGLLAVSSVLAATGLVFLSKSSGMTILLAATLYGFGKTFFWPTMLGVVAEQFPRGGALTLNMIAGIGMLGVGVLGTHFFGYIQDKDIAKLEQEQPGIYAQVAGTPKESVFGTYRGLDADAVDRLPKGEKEVVEATVTQAQKNALMTVAIFPVFMFFSYLALIGYFRLKGGYKAEVLTGHAAEDKKFTGGIEGAVEA